MTAKTPDSPQESRPPTAASSTSSVPAQPAEPTTVSQPVVAAPTPAPAPAQATTAASAAVPKAVEAGKTPAKPPAKKPAPRASRDSRLSGVAFVVAVLAVLVAVGSTLVSIYALDVARKAKSRTADVVGSSGQPSNALPNPSPVVTASPSPTTQRVQFAPEIVRADLRIPPADGCASVFVDIDSMQVGVDNGHEFYVSNCLGSTSLRIDRTAGAVPTQENPTPEVCVAQLAGSNPSSELVLPARVGLTFCLLTNKEEAARQGLPQRVGIVEVRDVAADKSVTVTVSTYRVPE